MFYKYLVEVFFKGRESAKKEWESNAGIIFK